MRRSDPSWQGDPRPSCEREVRIEMRKDVREFIRRLEAVSLTVTAERTSLRDTFALLPPYAELRATNTMAIRLGEPQGRSVAVNRAEGFVNVVSTALLCAFS
jgi:hypothetical protein